MSDKVAVSVLAWDWKNQPDIDALDRIVANLSNLTVRAYAVRDTGFDAYAVVFANGDLDQENVQLAYDRWMAIEDGSGWVTVEGER